MFVIAILDTLMFQILNSPQKEKEDFKEKSIDFVIKTIITSSIFIGHALYNLFAYTFAYTFGLKMMVIDKKKIAVKNIKKNVNQEQPVPISALTRT